MFSTFRTTALAGALTVAFAGVVQAASISYTVAPFSQSYNGGFGVVGGSDFTLTGTSATKTLSLTPGVSQAAFLDDNNTAGTTDATGTHTGIATSNMTINGVTHSVSEAFTFDSQTLLVSLSGGAPVVFDLGTFDVTVTPIAGFDRREANFLETAIAAPEPATLSVLALGLAGLGLVLRTRRA